MSRIMTVSPDSARGVRLLMLRMIRRQYGGMVPGIMQVLLTDLRIARPLGSLYNHLHLRKSSPMTRLQREMLATVVNGAIGGAP